jgi:transcriptional regulator with XRE-family HTH domain
MEDLRKAIIEYKEKNKVSDKELAEKLSLTTTKLKSIEEGKTNLSKEEIDALINILNQKTSNNTSSKKAVRILDLIFRFMATIMSLVVVILSIYNFSNTKTLIALLAIGVACLSITTLPKIEK